MIVGFSGLAGAGKSTAAAILAARGFARVSFADPLKRMLAALDLDPAPPGVHPRAWRETPRALLCGRTERQALQALGTEWGRVCIGADVWVRLWARESAKWPDVVADDVRFENEAAAIRQAGGVVIRIDREGAGSSSGAGHVSETIPFAPDAAIANDGTPEELAAALLAIVSAQKSRRSGSGSGHESG